MVHAHVFTWAYFDAHSLWLLVGMFMMMLERHCVQYGGPRLMFLKLGSHQYLNLGLVAY